MRIIFSQHPWLFSLHTSYIAYIAHVCLMHITHECPPLLISKFRMIVYCIGASPSRAAVGKQTQRFSYPKHTQERQPLHNFLPTDDARFMLLAPVEGSSIPTTAEASLRLDICQL